MGHWLAASLWRSSKVTLSVEGGGEGHVVEGARHTVRASVGRHAGNAVLGLVRGQLTAKLIRQDVVLDGGGGKGENEWRGEERRGEERRGGDERREDERRGEERRGEEREGKIGSEEQREEEFIRAEKTKRNN